MNIPPVNLSEGEVNFGFVTSRGPARGPREDLILYSAQASFAWPRVDLLKYIMVAAMFGFSSSSFKKSAGSLSLAGEASLVCIFRRT